MLQKQKDLPECDSADYLRPVPQDGSSSWVQVREIEHHGHQCVHFQLERSENDALARLKDQDSMRAGLCTSRNRYRVLCEMCSCIYSWIYDHLTDMKYNL